MRDKQKYPVLYADADSQYGEKYIGCEFVSNIRPALPQFRLEVGVNVQKAGGDEVFKMAGLSNPFEAAFQ